MYHKENCSTCIRKVLDLDSGIIRVRIIVSGQHAFRWSVTVQKGLSSETMSFEGRVQALKELQRLKTQYRQVGDCKLGA